MKYLVAFKAKTVIAILGVLGMALVACGGAAPIPTALPTTASIPATLPAPDEPASAGQSLFVSKGCAACHGQDGEGSAIAPALAGHSALMVKRQVRNPRFQMPAFSTAQISDAELEAIAVYIGSLGGDGHAHVEPLELAVAVEMHHWMALEGLKAKEQAEAIHHVGHIVGLLQDGEHRRNMEAILEGLQAGETHGPEHEIEGMLAGTASPDLTLAELHLRQALVALAVAEMDDTRHHVQHFQEQAGPEEGEQAGEILDFLEQGDLHGAEHEIQELLGGEEHTE